MSVCNVCKFLSTAVDFDLIFDLILIHNNILYLLRVNENDLILGFFFIFHITFFLKQCKWVFILEKNDILKTGPYKQM